MATLSILLFMKKSLQQRLDHVSDELALLQENSNHLSQIVTNLQRECSQLKTTPPSLPEIPPVAAVTEIISEPEPEPELTIIPEPLPEPEPLPTSEPQPKFDAPLLADHKDLEMQLGRVWSVRLGIVLLTTGFVFLSRYTYDSVIRDLGPGIRLAMMYLFSFLLTGAGLFFEQRKDSLKNYGRIVAGGGFAALYYCSFAAHHIDSLRVIDNPTYASILLTLSAGLICAGSIWRKSRVMMSTSLALAFYSISINPVGWMACVSALLLTVVGIFMMSRYRWAEVGFVVLVGSYFSFAWWQFAIGTHPFSSNYAFLPAYWLLFTVATFTARPKMLTDHHTLFAVLNNTAFFALFSYHIKITDWAPYFWLFCLIFGGILLALSLFSKNHHPTQTRSLHLIKGLSLITTGLILILEGHTLFLTLLVEAITLMALNLKNSHPGKQAAAWIVATISFLSTFTTELSLVPNLAWICAAFGWIILGSLDTHLNRDRRNTVLNPVAIVTATIALALIFIKLMADWTTSDQAICIALISTISAALSFSKKATAYIFETLLVFHLAGVLALFYLLSIAAELTHIETLYATLISAASFALLTTLHYRQQNIEYRQKAHLLASFFLTATILLFILKIISLTEITSTVKIAICLIIPFLGAIAERFTKLKAHALIALIPLAYIATLFTFEKETIIVALIITLAHLIYLIKNPRHWDHQLREYLLFTMAVFFGTSAIIVISTSIFSTAPDKMANLIALLIALSATTIMATIKRYHYYYITAICTLLLSLSVYFSYITQSPVIYLCILAPLAFHLLQSHRKAERTFTIITVPLLLVLWHQITLDLSPVAATWAGLGTILLFTGLACKSRAFRLLGLITLIASLGHLMLLDLSKLDALPRILSFMTLGLGLLGLGYVYNRYQDHIKKIL